MHATYDERGTMVLESSSEILCFAAAMQLQRNGRLATVLLDGRHEVLFAPALSGAEKSRAPTALEVEARMRSRVEVIEAKPVGE
jgi:hypothetical protein